ncbi:RNA polymerase sigma factor [Lacisediminihabitans profunda]|uniref:Sigma-70 family RNA polymerase sigma factor n=1 Tax=Lacisediminihabitans profunda TaxID=2594790 RepID=A0A5C8URB8_9MICO|nr:sigma-70 family RNA polymerase sigma factor [Lacisediminihabitans profunda]TXN31124.1 sigma-70 family RNA polymerase sigma factor [Lacisediminihabitans profunda]
METLTDEMLALGSSNPAEVFTLVYQALSPSVHGYLVARGVDDPEAVTHDVFLALYPRLASVNGGVKGLKTLIFSIAHARSVDHHRLRARSPMITEYLPELDSRSTASAEDHALDSALDAGALELLAHLGDDQREVLNLRIIADLSLEQTAAIMDKTPGAIKQLQRRALGNLKQELEMKVGNTP